VLQPPPVKAAWKKKAKSPTPKTMTAPEPEAESIEPESQPEPTGTQVSKSSLPWVGLRRVDTTPASSEYKTVRYTCACGVELGHVRTSTQELWNDGRSGGMRARTRKASVVDSPIKQNAPMAKRTRSRAATPTSAYKAPSQAAGSRIG
jgi:hypothetical protein